MIVLFSLLVLFSLVALCVGLASPRLLSKLFRRELTRKNIALVFGGLFLFGSAVSLAITPDPQTKPEAVPAVAEAPVSATTSTAVVPVAVGKDAPEVPSPAVAAVVPVLVATGEPQIATSTTESFLVTHVVDGDTFDVDMNGETVRIRMIGIDTPETVDPRKPVQCFGREASAKMKGLIMGKRLTLEVDPSQGDLDKYKRLIRFAFLPDGTDVGLALIQEGYAHEYTYDKPYKYQAAYKAAEKAARIGEKGLWSPDSCDGVTAGTAAPNSPSTSSGSPNEPVAPSQSGDGPAAKKSSTGICHERGTTYYEKTKEFTPYASVEACLQSGGRLPKA